MNKLISLVLILFTFISFSFADSHSMSAEQTSISEGFNKLWKDTGLYHFLDFEEKIAVSKQDELVETFLPLGVGQIVMILVGLTLIYLAIVKKFEPLLLLPIGFGSILTESCIKIIGFY